MLALSFRNRITFLYLVSTASLVLMVYMVIYNIVSQSVYSHIDSDIIAEVQTLLGEIKTTNGNVALVDAEEWKEREHNTLNVNPIYIQILDSRKMPVDKSPNLKNEYLKYNKDQKDRTNYNTTLVRQNIRQTQFPVTVEDRVYGYILIAVPLEDANYLLKNLREVLMISFPLVLLVLFFVTRFIAGRSIKPVQSIIDTAGRITNDLHDQRIALPPNRDELYTLSTTINNLLDRIENAIKREKQFTSDASHELRTPLAVVKGTLEVLIRKPRNTEEYQEKIKYCINEVDRLNNLVDQLLLLARFENQKVIVNRQEIALDEIILESLERFSSKIESANMVIDFTFEKHFYVFSDAYLVSIVIENLLSNALKYSGNGKTVRILLEENEKNISCSFEDNGVGIDTADLDKIYEQFYRSQATEHPGIKGTGLGLSLVKRLCDLLQIELDVKSLIGKGTTAILLFRKN